MSALLLSLGVLLALATAPRAISADPAPTPQASPAPLGPEVPERRTRSSRTYLGDDGWFVTRFFTESVNYKDANGDWRAIDNDLEPTAGGHANKANRYRLELPDSLAKLVRVTDGGGWIEYGLGGSTARGSFDGNKGAYPDAAKGVDVAYEATADAVKETLALAGPQSQRSFRFALKTSTGLSPKKRQDGAIDIVDSEGAVRFAFAPPLMWDSAKPRQESRAVAIDLAREGSGYYRIDVMPDPTWLDAKSRQWPVIVDPTATFTGPTQDCYIVGGGADPEARFQDLGYCSRSALWVGMQEEQQCVESPPSCYAANPAHRALLKFDLGSVIPKNAILSNTYLSLLSQTSTPMAIDAHRVTQPWTTSTTWKRADLSTLWTSPGGDFEPSPAAQLASSWTSGVRKRWDLSGLVSSWVSGSIPNHGVLLKQSSETGTSGSLFDSNESADATRKPWLEVSWQEPRGELPFNTFENQQLTDRSSLGVNVSTGNLLIRNNDLEINGTGLDLIVPRFYNSQSNAAGSFGSRWNIGSGGDVQILEASNGALYLHGPTAEVLRFGRNPDGSFESPRGIRSTMRRVSSSTVELTANDTGEKLAFTRPGSGTQYRLSANADRYGNAIRFSYSLNDGKLGWITDTQGRVTTVTRGVGGITKLTDSTGRSVQYSYDGSNLQTYIDAAGKTTTYGYDTSGRLSSITTPGGRVTKVTYDAQGRVYQVIRTTDDAQTTGPTTTFTYGTGTPCATDETKKTVVSDPLATGTSGHTTTYCSDGLDTVTTAVDGSGRATSYTYDAKANLTSMTRPGGGVTNLAYDSATQNLLCIQRGVTAVQDCRGSASGLKTSFEYANTDALTKYFPTRVTNPQGNGIALCYNSSTPTCGIQSGPAGSLQSMTNGLASQNTQRFTYNAKGNLTDATDARGSTSSYGYDGSGDNLTSVTPPSGAALGSWAIEPDALSRPRVVTDGKGQTATYTYDPLDRPTGTAYAPGGPTFSYTYDPDGATKTLTDPGGTTTYTLDRLSRLTREDFPGALFNAYSYDAASNLKTLTDSGGTTTYAYNSLNQLSSLTEPPNTSSTTFAYNSDGGRTLIRYPSGVTVNTAYDNPSGRVTSVNNKGPSGNLLLSFAYTYTAGTRDTELAQAVTDSWGNKTTNTYDALDRLIDASTVAGPNSTNSRPSHFAFTMDGNGNRLTSTITRAASTGGTTGTYAYDNASLPCWRIVGTPPSVCSPAPSGATLYSHDANGDDLDNGHQSFTYNAARQPASVLVRAVGVLAPLAYRGDGQSQPVTDGSYAPQSNLLGIGVRAKAPSSSATRTSAGVPCDSGTSTGSFATLAAGSAATSYYTRATDGTALSQRTPSNTTSPLRNYLYDGEGSVVGLTDQTGALSLPRDYQYEPYGHPANTTSLGDPNPFGYLGSYSPGLESGGVICGGPNSFGDLLYDAEDGRFTQGWGALGDGDGPGGHGSRSRGIALVADPVRSAEIQGGLGPFTFGYGENDDGSAFTTGPLQLPLVDGAPKRLKLGFGFSGHASTGRHDGGGVGIKTCFVACFGLNTDTGFSFGGGLEFGAVFEW